MQIKVLKWLVSLNMPGNFTRFVDKKYKNGLVAELGCGNGSFLEKLRKKGFKNLVGCDISCSYLPETKIRIECTDALNFCANLGDNTVDCFILFDVIEHLDLEYFLNLVQLIARKISVDGEVILRFPNMGSPLASYNFFGDITHKQALNINSLRQLLFKSKLRIKSTYEEPLRMPLSIKSALGIVLYPLCRFIFSCVQSAFRIDNKYLSPNILVKLEKSEN